jgi:DNA-directed RNA polymerase subunit N (RpoN/RPB10)
MLDYHGYIKQQKRDVKKVSKKYNIKEDYIFGDYCENYISGNITILEFNNYLTDDLYLNITEKELNENFDSQGNLMILNESLLTRYPDLSEGLLDLPMEFFKRIVAKIKNFLSKTLSKISENKEKVMEVLASFFGVIFKGLKTFGNFLVKNKKGIKSTLTKISVSLGITATVSYLLSFFGAGWAVAMGAKMGASVVGKKVGKAVVGEKPTQTQNIQTQTQKLEESIKSTLMKIGAGIIAFFKILRKFKIAVLIFFGVIFILELIFEPLFAPILQIASMSNFTDIFSDTFSVSVDTLPEVEVPENIEIDGNIAGLGSLNMDINDVELDADANLDGSMANSMKDTWNLSKGNITENPTESSKSMVLLYNQVKTQVGSEGADIKGGIENSPDVTTAMVAKITGKEELSEEELKSIVNTKAKIADFNDKQAEHIANQKSITPMDSKDTDSVIGGTTMTMKNLGPENDNLMRLEIVEYNSLFSPKKLEMNNYIRGLNPDDDDVKSVQEIMKSIPDIKQKLLDDLGLTRYCCRMRMVSYLDQVKLIV